MPLRPRSVQDAMLTDVKLCDVTATLGEVRDLFDDQHVHSAVVVDAGLLLTVIDRADLVGLDDDHALAVHAGTLGARVIAPDADLDDARAILLTSQRRRLAVVATDGTFQGLLCLKRTLEGFCSEQDAHARRS